MAEENVVTLRVPEGFFLENEWPETLIESAFGSFERTVKTMENGSIRIVQKRILNDSVQPATAWLAFLDFEKNVAKAMSGKLVLVKKT